MSKDKNNQIIDVDLTGNNEDAILCEFVKFDKSEVHTAKLSVK